jgi:hypothetical protein
MDVPSRCTMVRTMSGSAHALEVLSRKNRTQKRTIARHRTQLSGQHGSQW